MLTATEHGLIPRLWVVVVTGDSKNPRALMTCPVSTRHTFHLLTHRTLRRILKTVRKIDRGKSCAKNRSPFRSYSI